MFHSIQYILIVTGYYSKAFPTVAQRDISSLIKTLWQKDLFHAEWQIMAQVYSFIRDSNVLEGVKYDLGGFLVSAVPVMGVPPNTEYIAAHGWMLSQNQDGGFSLEQITPPKKAGIQAAYRPVASSPIELLQWLASAGLLGNHGQQLVQQMEERPDAFTSTSVPTTRSNIPQFVAQVRASPANTAAAIMGIDPSHPAISLGVGIATVPDFRALGMVPIPPTQVGMAQSQQSRTQTAEHSDFDAAYNHADIASFRSDIGRSQSPLTGMTSRYDFNDMVMTSEHDVEKSCK